MNFCSIFKLTRVDVGNINWTKKKSVSRSESNDNHQTKRQLLKDNRRQHKNEYSKQNQSYVGRN